MKRFLLLALTAGLLSPIAANAESYWLVIIHTRHGRLTMEKIEVPSMAQCEEQGKEWSSFEVPNNKMFESGVMNYKCFKG